MHGKRGLEAFKPQEQSIQNKLAVVFQMQRDLLGVTEQSGDRLIAFQRILADAEPIDGVDETEARDRLLRSITQILRLQPRPRNLEAQDMARCVTAARSRTVIESELRNQWSILLFLHAHACWKQQIAMFSRWQSNDDANSSGICRTWFGGQLLRL